MFLVYLRDIGNFWEYEIEELNIYQGWRQTACKGWSSVFLKYKTNTTPSMTLVKF